VIWFHRLVSNLAASGRWRGGSTGMAAGGWFIPIANFIIPFRYANDAWTATEPDYDSPSGSKGILYSWWTFWVVAFVVRLVASSVDPSAGDITASNFLSELHDYRTARQIYALAFGLLAIAAILAIRVVLSLTRRAEAISAG
jgi:hypothetical protein